MSSCKSIRDLVRSAQSHEIAPPRLCQTVRQGAEGNNCWVGDTSHHCGKALARIRYPGPVAIPRSHWNIVPLLKRTSCDRKVTVRRENLASTVAFEVSCGPFCASETILRAHSLRVCCSGGRRKVALRPGDCTPDDPLDRAVPSGELALSQVMALPICPAPYADLEPSPNFG